jgi:hypothetical protein
MRLFKRSGTAPAGVVASRDMDAERDRLAALKRRTYAVALALILTVLAIAWLIHGPDDGYRYVTAPVFVALLGGVLLAVASGRVAMRRIEPLMLLVLLAMPLSRQLWLFHVAGPPDEEWLRFLGNSYWATSALIVAVEHDNAAVTVDSDQGTIPRNCAATRPGSTISGSASRTRPTQADTACQSGNVERRLHSCLWSMSGIGWISARLG